MKNKRYVFVILFLALLFLISPLYAALAAEEASQPVSEQHVPIEIKISEEGFNGKAEYAIAVSKGQTVELIFVWDERKQPMNNHIMAVEGYDLKTGMLNKDNPRQVLRFVASKEGTFRISCIFPCVGHVNLYQGSLVVKSQALLKAEQQETRTSKAQAESDPIKQKETAKASAPNLVLVVPKEWRRGQEVTILAQLTTEDGYPVEGAEITFYKYYNFFLAMDSGSISRNIEIGKVITDKEGIAKLKYAGRLGGEVKFKAKYNEAIIATVEAKIGESGYRFYQTEAGIPMPFLVHYYLAPNGLSQNRLVQNHSQGAPQKHLFALNIPALVLGLLIAGIWFTYLRIAYAMYRISHSYEDISPTRPKYILPVFLMIFVVILALTLLSIIFTSPDTHLHLHG